jgi:pSer/pThr/pTyr-binding forkhead associated (FHA) protein
MLSFFYLFLSLQKKMKIRVIPHLDSAKALVFPVMEFTLEESVALKIGRSDARSSQSPAHMTFKSKVVSRKHAEIYLESGKVSYPLYTVKYSYCLGLFT